MNYSQDMTEGKLRSLLESTLTEHSQRCLHSPEFTVTSGMEEEASLLMSCSVSVNVRFLERIPLGSMAQLHGQKPQVCSSLGFMWLFFHKIPWKWLYL